MHLQWSSIWEKHHPTQTYFDLPEVGVDLELGTSYALQNRAIYVLQWHIQSRKGVIDRPALRREKPAVCTFNRGS